MYYLICLKRQTNPVLYYTAYPGHNKVTHVWTDDPNYATKFVTKAGAWKETSIKDLKNVKVVSYKMRIEIEDV